MLTVHPANECGKVPEAAWNVCDGDRLLASWTSAEWRQADVGKFAARTILITAKYVMSVV